ncbi:multi-sensor hybrid histidine kinase [Methylobacterium sp. 4-46]|uniref:PAS domain-containing protein n=1 Tax=unclassified Methylobacterium TaxID=2615210 RepID=UPI000152D0A7|nr:MULTISPECIES: PAS domain-containing protein [Methylobacterium]ACA16314.1 multi-sensor hybrid histidine kinase [Methylobacterium sp. 4-46]WFT82022.1 PAS domain-containing protein [Methylobacterium nodulans]
MTVETRPKEVIGIAGGGALGALVRAHDWAATPLGPIGSWPGSLRTAVGILLLSPVPMVLLWGEDGVMIYNDAYAVLAAGRHPALLGSRVREGWPEVAAFNDHVMRVVLAGGTLAYKDQELVLHRSGRPERVWMNLDYSPVPDEGCRPAGVLAVVVETTARVLAERRLVAEAKRQRRILEQAPRFICILRGPDHVIEFANAAFRALFGAREVLGRSLRAAVPDLAGPGVLERLDQVRATGERRAARAARVRLRPGPEGPARDLRLDLVYAPVTDEEGRVVGVLCEGTDVTERHRAQVALRRRSRQLQQLAEAALGVARAPTLAATLDAITRAARRIIGARQAVTSLTGGEERSRAVSALSPDRRCAARGRDLPAPDGTGIDAMVCEQNRPARMSQAELEAHPRRRGVGAQACAPPPMRGWLAAPLIGRDGRNLGLIQLSDRVDGGEFDATDEAMLVQLAQIASASVERMLAEAALRRSEAALGETVSTLDALLAHAPIGFAFFDPQHRYVRLNAVLAEINGLPVAAHLGRSIEEVLPVNAVTVGPALDEVVATGRSLDTLEVDGETPARPGELRSWLTSFFPVFGPDGAVAYVGVTVIDITERRRAEAAVRDLAESLERRVQERTAALAESERRFRAIFDTTFQLTGLAALDGTILVVNRAALEAAGVALAEVVGVKMWDSPWWRDLPEEAARLREGIARVARGAFVRYESRHRLPIGLRSFDFSMKPVLDEAGRPIFLVAEGRDVTDQRRAEEALRQAQKMEAVGQLTGGLAHDFNNLLTGISGSLELLQSRLAQGRVSETGRYIDAAQGAAKRAAALTHRLLAFSRRQTLDPRPIDVNLLIAGMEELIRRTIGPAVSLSVEPDPAPWTILVDPGQLENALLNLCINARDAMPEGGRIVIATAKRELGPGAGDLPPGAYATLTVTDTGAGMSPEVLARAFDPFFTTKPLGQGTGLGLSMIYGFVRQSGGQVRIDSAQGRGTAVALLFPRHHGPARAPEEVPDRAAPPRARDGETVLVVDDEASVRLLVAEVLQDLGYRALEARDGAAGLAQLRAEGRIDLLVTDVGLPGGMNGRQLADAGRVLRPDLKVLFITGYAETTVVGAGDLQPGMEVLTKPFVLEELARRIRGMIAGAPGAGPGAPAALSPPAAPGSGTCGGAPPRPSRP